MDDHQGLTLRSPKPSWCHAGAQVPCRPVQLKNYATPSAYHGDKLLMCKCFNQMFDRDVSAKEKGCILLTEMEQPTIGANGCNGLLNALPSVGTGRLPELHRQGFLGGSNRQAGAEVDPRVLAQKPQHRVGAGQQHRNHWKLELATLAL